MKEINWNGFNSGGLKPFYEQNKHHPEFVKQFHAHYSSKIPNFYAPDTIPDTIAEPTQATKRPSTSTGPQPEKVVVQEAPSTSTQPSQERAESPELFSTQFTLSTIPDSIDVDMPLPATAQGQGGTGDGNANSMMPIYKAIQPHTNFGSKISTYRKVHRFLTFGIAHNWISETVGTENRKYLSTALAEIPWQKPFFYMTPSEFNILPIGAYVKELRLKVICRGVRIAFETAAADTTLATLNQIQNLQVAEGLNKTGWGVNFSYDSFDATQTMKPTSVAAASYTQYPQYMYGDDNITITNFIPNHQVGFKMPLYNYFNLTTKDTNFGGCPPIAEMIEFYDGKTTIDQIIKETKWNPDLAPLTAPLKYNHWSLSGTSFTLPVNGILAGGKLATQNVTAQDSTGSTITTSETTITGGAPISGDFSYQDDIDKSQLYRQGPWGQYKNPRVQPSVHIGIQAIPALTTSTFFTPVDKWTDSQCDFEVIAEMDVCEFNPTMFPHLNAANVPAGDQMFRLLSSSQFVDSELRPTYAGLYLRQ